MVKIVSAILLCVFASHGVNAETKIDVRAEYAFGPNISQNEACSRAEVKAKNNALRGIVGEKMTTSQIESCVDNGSDLDCTLFEDTFSYMDSGYITKTDNYIKNIREEAGASICSVNFTATVAKVSQKSDPSYFLDTEMLPSILLREGEPLQVHVSPSKPSFIYIYGWFPEIEKDSFFLLSQPMDFHEKQVSGNFIFPDTGHELIAMMPKDAAKDSISEYLIILASKTKMAHDLEISRSKFFKIINSTARDSWVMDKISYKIVKKKI
jgi:hypothetical protein